MHGSGPPSAVGERWQELLVDADGIAADYAAEGWETLVVPTGDVTPLSGDPFGLDVLAPGDVFEALEELVASASFDTSHVYHADEGRVRFLAVVVEASDDEVAVVVPAYVDLEAAEDLRERALAAGVTYTHVRPLSDDARVTFTHDDPSLFFDWDGA